MTNTLCTIDGIKELLQRQASMLVAAGTGQLSFKEAGAVPYWAIVYDENGTQRLHLVRETKDIRNLDDLDWNEAMRILFAEHHFHAAPIGPVGYDYATDRRGLLIGGAGGDD